MNDIQSGSEDPEQSEQSVGAEIVAADVSAQAGNARKANRRDFLRGAATVAGAAAIPLQPLIGPKEFAATASTVSYSSGQRAQESFQYRLSSALAEQIDQGVLPDNGDSARFPDYSFAHTKALPHDALGVPNANAVTSRMRKKESKQVTPEMF